MIWQIAVIDNRYKMGVSETFLAIGKHIRDLLGVKATVVNKRTVYKRYFRVSSFPLFVPNENKRARVFPLSRRKIYVTLCT